MHSRSKCRQQLLRHQQRHDLNSDHKNEPEKEGQDKVMSMVNALNKSYSTQVTAARSDQGLQTYRSRGAEQ